MSELHFYSSNHCRNTPKLADVKNIGFELKYPCIVLLRQNNWNDYNFVTHFYLYYCEDNLTTFELDGRITIIQKEAKETELPQYFEALDRKTYFCRGSSNFYLGLRRPYIAEIRIPILQALNDVYNRSISRKTILSIDKDLEQAYDLSLYRDSTELTVTDQYVDNAKSMLGKIKACLKSASSFENEQKNIIHRLLYGSVIAVLESYLGDAFKYYVTTNDAYLMSFLANYDYKEGERKIDLSTFAVSGDNIKEIVKEKVKQIMNKIIFHQLLEVKGLYKNIFNVVLDFDWPFFENAVKKRHDIFHRNGKNLIGYEIVISEEDVRELIEKVTDFIAETNQMMMAQ